MVPDMALPVTTQMPKAEGLSKMIRVFRIRDARTTGKCSEPSKA